MEKKKFWHSLFPLEWIIIGFAMALFDLLIHRSFNPFSLLGFIFIALFEKYFRKRKWILSSNLMSMVAGITMVFAIKFFVIDFVAMKSDVPDLNIRKEARLFFQPALFMLKDGDLVICRPSGANKNYLAVFKGIENGKYNLLLGSKKQLINSNRRSIKGRIFFIISPPQRDETLNKEIATK